MASSFIEKNKRKSILSVLLLLLGSKAKYIAVLLVVGLASAPFLLSSEAINRIVTFAPVAAVMRAVGFAGPAETASADQQAQQQMAAEMARAGHVSRSSSFWDRFLKAANAPLPAGGKYSSMDMLRGGKDVFGPPVVKEDNARPPKPNEVKGVASAAEQEKDASGGAVDLKAQAQAGGADAGSMYGDLMAGAMGSGQMGSLSAAPYANRTLLSAPGGAADKASGLYGRAMNQTEDRVPAPGAPKRVAGKMGRVTGFSWKNMSRKSGRSAAVNRLNNKKPMFQLSESFAMAGMAFDSRSAEMESAYSGATFDGNEVDADFLQTDAIVPAVPSAAFASSLLGNIDQLEQSAIDCANAGMKEGAQAGTDGQDMAEIQQTMDFEDPPSCCNGSAVRRWNRKVDGDGGASDRAHRLGLVGLCNDINANNQVVADKCQKTYTPMTCNKYADMHITCHWYSCLVEILCWICVFAVGGIVLTTLAMTGVFGSSAGQWVKGIVRWMSGYDSPGDAPES